MTFSRARLRGHRQGRRLTQAALGALVGLEAGEVDAIEAGLSEPSELLVVDLARALDLSLHELHRISADYAEDYLSTVMSYARPISDDACRRAAHALSWRRLAAS